MAARRLLATLLVLRAASGSPETPLPRAGLSSAQEVKAPPRAGISARQEAELELLLKAATGSINELAAGEAKDRVRLLRAKLESLRQVAAHTQEHEWDAMIKGLLDSSEYGVAELAPHLKPEGAP